MEILAERPATGQPTITKGLVEEAKKSQQLTYVEVQIRRNGSTEGWWGAWRCSFPDTPRTVKSADGKAYFIGTIVEKSAARATRDAEVKTAAEAEEAARKAEADAKAAILDPIRDKRRAKQALTAEEQQAALDALLGI